ncbi:MAG: hypothetical protein ACI9LM_003174 [Alteromonadaceae bacterium]|jgi:hypothetical protein
MQTTTKKIGLGCDKAAICVYIENIPPLEQYQSLHEVISLKEYDIYNIGQQTGNHWRKIFNVYAKLIFEIDTYQHSSWQNLRDKELLQSHSNESLFFSPPRFDTLSSTQIHIIMGRTYAKKLNLDTQCFWLSKDFAINEDKRLIISPYFDYRQLSNLKITQLANLIKNFK